MDVFTYEYFLSQSGFYQVLNVVSDVMVSLKENV